jgi:hypothetical protein
LTSPNNGLTDSSTLVPGAPGNGHGHGDTKDTEDLDTALDLLRIALGAEAISTDVWTPAEQGPCNRCSQACCRYGYRGSPLCASCSTPPRQVTCPAARSEHSLPATAAGVCAK